MKFDLIVSNPPYNNSLWKKFVEKQIKLLKEDGYMVTIHPDNWMYSSKHSKFYNTILSKLEVLHIKGFSVFQNAAISVDWYLFNNGKKDNKAQIYYPNGESEILELKKDYRLLKFSTRTLEYSILNKIISDKDNKAILITNGYHPLYKKYDPNGQYKQCGGEGNGTGWCTGNFHLTNEHTEHQFDNKIVMSYVRRPRAQFFSKEDSIGVITAHYWLTDNINANPNSMVMLLNSKMFWKLHLAIINYEE